VGAISGITVDTPGDGYLSTGIKKFQDALPGTCDPTVDGTGCPQSAQTDDPTMANKFIPLAVPTSKIYEGQEADVYEIGLVQYRTQFSSDLPPTLARGYVQLSTDEVPGQHVPLYNELLNGDKQPTTYYGVTRPQWLGPVIAATKDRPVRIVFRNLLPTGADGNLFLPVDSSMMGSGMGPEDMPDPEDKKTVLDAVRNPTCTVETPKSAMCYTENRATLHLHGGTTPWISDGTPHQWITPAGEDTSYPQGVSVANVPDMTDASGAVECDAADDGCQTFFYTNEQSARLMFYHDHSWGITRLNVYAGEAAGYLITDDTEKNLVDSGAIPGAADTIPLIVQDRTFTPDEAQLKLEDPTWDSAAWGSKGSFWYQHVYMPAQNPGDPTGFSAYGRWMYGPWFWPAAKDAPYGPIPNPYYDPKCTIDDPATWPEWATKPFCEPEQIPGTPNISTGMEQFNDTPIVNGVAYPTATLEPKSYRLRILNAANDRFFNFQWYIADPSQGDGTTEVALKPEELKAAQTDPNVFPTPEGANNSAYGPSWVQIASEGGFLPAPAVIDGQQPLTWITDPTRFDYGNGDKHSLLMGPAERADVVVDFSRFAGQTLILYNDAPAAYPARVPQYDYYTGDPDQTDAGGAPTTLPGYGPNTRTVMQVKIADTAPAPAFNLAKLQTAFSHKANGTGVFESGQNPIVVGQAAYNSAYGTTFSTGSNCNAPGTAVQTCDGFPRVDTTGKVDQSTGEGGFGFNTLTSPKAKVKMDVQPKAMHDEMNAASFDEFGRMTANLGIEADPPTAGAQNVTLYPYVNPTTELIDGTNLPLANAKAPAPKATGMITATGNPVTSIATGTQINTLADGTQIWRFTHNGVDTHPIHFHLFDVQLIGRVTWDNIIIPPDPNELGWKDTVRVSPLQDTIVAVRPVVPTTPFEVPNSVRELNPMMPDGWFDPVNNFVFNSVTPQGAPTTTKVTNQLVNFGWEYVYHCHILSHEEMDMMRPVDLVLPPTAPSDVAATGMSYGGPNGVSGVEVTWSDNSLTETSFLIQRSTDGGATWVDAGTVQSPLSQDQATGTGSQKFYDEVDPSVERDYRVLAVNTVGYINDAGDFPTMSASSASDLASASLADLGTTRIDTTVSAGNITVSEVGDGTLQVSVTAADGSTPVDGTVTATYGTQELAKGDVANGAATLSVLGGPPLLVGVENPVTLSFTPALPAVYKPSTGTVEITVTPRGPGIDTMVAAADVAISSGQDATLQVSVTAADGSVPDGTVTLKQGADVLATFAVANGAGDVSLPVPGSALSLGLNGLALSFDPTNTAVYNPSAVTVQVSVTVPSTVTAAATPTTLKAKQDKSTIQVSVTAPGASPTGTVTAFDGATQLATATLAGGQANLVAGPLTATGAHTITLQYSGDATTAPGSATVTLTVQNGNVKGTAPAVKATGPSTAKVKGAPSVFDVTVTVPGGVIATGTVQAFDGNTAVGAPVSLVNGAAQFTVGPFTSPGNRNIQFRYSGDGGGIPAASVTVKLAVSK
jgi:FtsP/CotA-like multicopper oxidase with cupredoxin domain